MTLRWAPVGSILGLSEDADALSNRRPPSRDLGSDAADDQRDDAELKDLVARGGRHRALHISIAYQEGECSGILLPPLSGQDGDDLWRRPQAGPGFSLNPGAGADAAGGVPDAGPGPFLDLPVLMLRMPPALKLVVTQFLETAFDCRVSPLHLGTRSLVQSLETWARWFGLPSRGPFAKELLVTLAFYIAPPPAGGGVDGGDEPAEHSLGVKSVDVMIPAIDLPKMVAAGKSLESQPLTVTVSSGGAHAPGWKDSPEKRRQLAGRLHEEGWAWRRQDKSRSGEGGPPLAQPFTEALGAYLKEHLALDLFHPGVRITKVACCGFVMTEGRLKVLGPGVLEDSGSSAATLLRHRRAVWELLSGVVDKGSGKDLS